MKNIFGVLLLVAFVFTSCEKDEQVEITLVANAGEDQIVSPMTKVTLDGTRSSGSSDLMFSWKYSGTVPESEINLQNTNTSQPSFVPPKAGEYRFALTISGGGKESTDDVLIEAFGATEIGGVLETNTTLININNDASQADYLIESDLIIPEGITLNIQEDVTIQVKEGKGIVVEGLLTNLQDEQSYFENIELMATNGWKGILVDGGSINLSGTIIKNAGFSTFEGQTEAAAITFNNEESTIIQLSRNEFQNSEKHDILVSAVAYSVKTVSGNTFSAKTPVKAPISFIGLLADNTLPLTYDYMHFTPNPISSGDEFPSNSAFFLHPGKYFIDGSLRALSRFAADEGVTIYMKENTSLIFEGAVSIGIEDGAKCSIMGLNNAKWNGIAVVEDVEFRINNCDISGAGAAPVVGGNINSTVKAAIYQKGECNGLLRNCIIKDVDGYGVYSDLDNETLTDFKIRSSHFENISIAAIRVNAVSVTSLIGKANSSNLDADVPGCLVQLDGMLSPYPSWEAIEGSYFLIDADIDFFRSGGVWLREGVHLKYKSGRAFIWDDSNYDNTDYVRIEGTAENPVIMEGEIDSPGSWGGFLLEGNYNISHLNVKNGGEFLLPGASEKANIYYDFRNLINTDQNSVMQNTTVSGSDGYGMVKSNRAIAKDFEASEDNNTFSDNNLGNFFQE